MGEVVSYTKLGIDGLVAGIIVSGVIENDTIILTKADATTIEIPIPPAGVTQEQLDTALAALVDSSPETLNTLNELAAALGDDPNFATTIINTLATKADLVTGRVPNEQSSEFLMRVVVHGADGLMARPAGGAAIVVHWIGTAAPANAEENDLWTAA